jgi:hypothetical protein
MSDMTDDREMQRTKEIKKSKLFALQLDESTDIQNNSIYLHMYDTLTMLKRRVKYF